MGKYLPCARLGSGGMADVFLTVAQGAHGVKKLTVVKRLRNPDDPDLVRMFLDEARLAARLSHPNIVHTYEVGEARGDYFIAMEYLEGQPLVALLKELRETPEKLGHSLVASIVVQALKGLHYAHEFRDFDGTPLGIVHRDVSPHNLFVTYNGEVKLLDFGIAKTAVKSTRTETGVLKGKLSYMAPEQAGMREVNRQADVFAIGIVLWEMLARRQLFSGDPIAILNSIVNDPIPSPRAVRPDVPPELEAIAMKALERPLDRRYANAELMRVDLERYLRSSGNATSDNELARLMDDLFAGTREKTRARIQEYVERMGRGSTDLTDSRDLPLVDVSSNPKIEGAAPAPALPVTIARPKARRVQLALAVGGALAAAAVLSVVSIRSIGATHPRAEASTGAQAEQPRLVHVRVETIPPGALVEWKGRRLGLTPDDFALDHGPQTLVVSHDGFEPEEIPVDLAPGDSAVRSLALRTKAGSTAPPAGDATASTAAPARPPRTPAPRSPGPVRPTATPSSPPAPTASAHRAKIRIIDDDH